MFSIYSSLSSVECRCVFLKVEPILSRFEGVACLFAFSSGVRIIGEWACFSFRGVPAGGHFPLSVDFLLDDLSSLSALERLKREG